MKRYVVPVIAVTLLLLGYICWRVSGQKHNVVNEVFGSPQVLNAFVTSQHATARRLHHRDDAPGNSDLLDHYTWGNAVPIAAPQVREIQRLLQQASSYDWNTRYAKACILSYGVLLQFRAESKTVSVALCFDCDMLGVYDTDGTNHTRMNREWDFDPIRNELVAAIKLTFPDDAEIQKLRERPR